MILEISKTFVDEDGADTTIYDIELTDDELKTIESLVTDWEDEPVIFRGKEYGECCDINDILQDVGKVIEPDHTIHWYVY